MSYYRIVFANNEIMYCDEIIDQIMTDFPTFEENNGQIIFALIKAENTEDATQQALAIKDKIIGAHQQQL